EGDRAGRGAGARRGGADGGGEGDGLAIDRRVGRGSQRRAAGGLVHRLAYGAAGAGGEVAVAAVAGGDGMGSDAQGGGAEGGLVQAIDHRERAGPQASQAVIEGDGPAPRAGTRRACTDSGSEGYGLSEHRRVDGRTYGCTRGSLVDDLAQSIAGAAGK